MPLIRSEVVTPEVTDALDAGGCGARHRDARRPRVGGRRRPAGPDEVAANYLASLAASTLANTTSGTGSTGDPELAADCAAIESALREAGTLDSVPTPSLGGEIDDRTADVAGQVADQLDGVDLQNDELAGAIDDIKDAFQKIAGGGTYTEDMQNAGQDAYLTIDELCAPYFTSGG